jgi:hypothetical protein
MLPQRNILPLETAIFFALAIVIALQCTGCARRGGNGEGPSNVSIDIWYGDEQSFGTLGNPQRWVNILGNVRPATNTSLTYSLNGRAPVALAIGPLLTPADARPCLEAQPKTLGERVRRLWDTCQSGSFLLCLVHHGFDLLRRHLTNSYQSFPRRLYQAGDFNVELDTDWLTEGRNTLLITATDKLKRTFAKSVLLKYNKKRIWPLPYSVDLRGPRKITSGVQIVDGEWTKDWDGLRPLIKGYDRLIAIGDITWKDYEIKLKVTVHSLDYSGSDNPVSAGPALGLITHWHGHSFTPIPECECSQPRCGWAPAGASGWYSFSENSLRIEGIANSRTLIRPMQLKTSYFWKMRSETVPGQLGTYYRMKFWKSASSEPANWDIQGPGLPRAFTTGSIVLDAHHVDATFADISIIPRPFVETANTCQIPQVSSGRRMPP